MYRLTVFITFIFMLFLAWIIYMADAGQQSIIFTCIKKIPYGDKMSHFFLYGILAFGVNHVFRLKSIGTGKFHIPYGAIFVIAFAVLEEFSQKLFPSRTCDMVDLAAGIIGISFFSIISFCHCFRPFQKQG